MQKLFTRIGSLAALAALAAGCAVQAGDTTSTLSSTDSPARALGGAHAATVKPDIIGPGPVHNICPHDIKNEDDGPTLSNPIIVNLFLGSYWATAEGQADMAGVNTAWKGMAPQGQLYEPIAEYLNPGTGTFWGSDWVGFGADQGTGTVVTQVQESTFESFIDFELAQNRAPAPSELRTIYFVYVGKGAFSQYDTSHSYIGHHLWYLSKQAGMAIHYAVIDYQANLATFTEVAYHELMETMTDPEGTTFFDTVGGGSEVGDLCEFETEYDWGKYVIQEIWSQKACACISAPNPPLTVRVP